MKRKVEIEVMAIPSLLVPPPPPRTVKRLPRAEEQARRAEIIRRYNGGRGDKLPVLSAAFGITRQRIHQIVNGRKGRT